VISHVIASPHAARSGIEHQSSTTVIVDQVSLTTVAADIECQEVDALHVQVFGGGKSYVYSQEASLAVVKVADELTVLVLDSRNAVKSDDVSRDFIAHTDTKDGSAVIAAGSSAPRPSQ
jgi:hypothetical protein